MPFFSVPAVRVRVNGTDVHVFEYASTTEADADAARVAPDAGSIGGSQIAWASAPHLFRGNRLIVLYVGQDAAILGALSALLGAQFAGR